MSIHDFAMYVIMVNLVGGWVHVWMATLTPNASEILYLAALKWRCRSTYLTIGFVAIGVAIHLAFDIPL